MDKYNAKYTAAADAGTLNQFGAAAYDSVYAIYDAMKKAVADGKSIPANVAPSDLCEILKEVFHSSDFSVTGATGTNIKWNEDGTVNKTAVKYVIKSAN